MPWSESLLLALGLGADAMSVCMAIGVRWHGPRQRFRMAWHMGLFQFMMPLLGWAGGQQLADLLRGVGIYIAGALVLAIGVKMLLEAIRSHPGAVAEKAEKAVEGRNAQAKDPTRGWSLITLSVATSLDALVVGFSLGLKPDTPIWLPSIIIGVVAAAMALAGIIVGKAAGEKFGKRAEFAGAIVLILLGASFPWL